MKPTRKPLHPEFGRLASEDDPKSRRFLSPEFREPMEQARWWARFSASRRPDARSAVVYQRGPVIDNEDW